MNKDQKEFFDKVIQPKLVDMAIGSNLPSDMTLLGSWDFIEAAEEYNKSKKSNSKYFLFSECYSEIYYEDGFQDLLEKITKDGCFDAGIEKWTDGEDVGEILSAATGWGGYAEITEEEYNILTSFCRFRYLVK